MINSLATGVIQPLVPLPSAEIRVGVKIPILNEVIGSLGPDPILWCLAEVTFINVDPVALEKHLLGINHMIPISPSGTEIFSGTENKRPVV